MDRDRRERLHLRNGLIVPDTWPDPALYRVVDHSAERLDVFDELVDDGSPPLVEPHL